MVIYALGSLSSIANKAHISSSLCRETFGAKAKNPEPRPILQGRKARCRIICKRVFFRCQVEELRSVEATDGVAVFELDLPLASAALVVIPSPGAAPPPVVTTTGYMVRELARGAPLVLGFRVCV
jgi:hypothetical protein